MRNSTMHKGIQLPKSLREQIASSGADDSQQERHGRLRKGSLGRKDARRLERSEKRERKAEFFSQTTRPSVKRTQNKSHPDAPPSKKPKLSSASRPSATQASRPSRIADTNDKPATKAHSKATAAAPEVIVVKVKAPKRKTRSIGAPSLRTQAEVDEDAKIVWLEAKLGLTKKRKAATNTAYTSAFADDGLDDLLQDIDRIDETISTADESGAEDIGDASSSAESGSDLSFDDGEAASIGGTSASRSQPDRVANEETGQQSIDAAELALGSAVPVSEQGTRYIPPHLRRQQLDPPNVSDEQIKLSRQLKGSLNRLSEQNIASITQEIEEAYRKYRRHDVTSTLTSLVLDGIAAHSSHLDSFVVLHAALVAALHKLVGVEFAAHFVERAVAAYEQHYAAEAAEDKACANVLVLLAELYTLRVVACTLVYDLVRDLAARGPAERDVELLLRLLRNCGQQLRHDDSAALGDIVQLVHTTTKEGTQSSRAKYMLETLQNLKNNKAKRGAAGADGIAAGESVERMKKFLSGLSKTRHVLAHEPLRVTLQDLHSADSKGKWWLVGAAWAGNPLADMSTSAPAARTAAPAESALVALARKHGMNTDVRRNIFIVLLSSEDYADALARLAQLRLSEVQQREIVRVALHCLGNEKTYNPFYALVLQQLTARAHAHRVTLQYALWDFLRTLGEARVGGAEVIKDDAEPALPVKKMSSTRLAHVARAYGWWIARGACDITVLKPLEFQLLLPQTTDFLRAMFTHLFVATQTSSPVATFGALAGSARDSEAIETIMIKAVRIPALQQGLVYFLGKMFRKAGESDEQRFAHWAANVAQSALQAGFDPDTMVD